MPLKFRNPFKKRTNNGGNQPQQPQPGVVQPHGNGAVQQQLGKKKMRQRHVQHGHGENIYIDDTTGKVTGIDHDMAFGKKDISQVGTASTHLLKGMPSLMDEEMGLAILRMTQGELEDLMGSKKGDYGRLSTDEKALALARLSDLKSHVFDLLAGDHGGFVGELVGG